MELTSLIAELLTTNSSLPLLPGAQHPEIRCRFRDILKQITDYPPNIPVFDRDLQKCHVRSFPLGPKHLLRQIIHNALVLLHWLLILYFCLQRLEPIFRVLNMVDPATHLISVFLTI